jgi:hypothetical protein
MNPMADRQYAILDHRSLILVDGPDRKAFLQGLVSADVNRAGAERAVYGAFLTPQGRFLHDFFLAERGEALLIEAEDTRRADFIKRLGMYRLRSKVAIAPFDGLAVYGLLGDSVAAALGLPDEAGAAGPFAGGLVMVDPRLPAAGLRAWLPRGADDALAAAGFVRADKTVWDVHRMRLGLPDGSRDMTPQKTLLLEGGFAELNGIDWQKGCFLGQELTARTRYRGLVKKRLLPVAIEGEAPEPGTPLLLGDAQVGELCSRAGSIGLAMIRLEAVEQLNRQGGALRAGTARLTPMKPDWAKFQT